VQCSDGTYRIVQDLDINEFSHARMKATRAELEEERDMVKNKFAS
jgi:malate dehydrogenase